ncbi:MAG: HAMP domain-containing protein [Deltaproteobacteria bacterium]|nr:HAMP domain-containing protein [Deltaproteobacteria bacterium]
MSIRAKIIGCFVVILSLFVVASAYSYLRFSHSNNRLQLVNQLFLPLSRLVVQLQGNIHSLSEDMRRYYFRPELSSESATFSRIVRDLYPLVILKKFTLAERLLIRHQDTAVATMVSEFSSILMAAKTNFEQLTKTTQLSQFENLHAELRARLANLSKRVDNECQTITLAAQNEGRENLFASLFLSTFVALFGLLTVIVSHRMLKPLPLLISSIRKITDGDLEQSLKLKADEKDEISVLARSFNRMLGALRERDQKIQHQQKELLQSERLAAIGQLSAEIVHEIRNPLNSLSLNIDWLAEELKNPTQDISRTIKNISKEVERLNQITESYLVRARVPMVEKQKTAVNELLREILDFSVEEDKERNISVLAALSPQELYIRSDRSRLKQALLNVFKNAREAMPRGGELKVSTEVKDNVYKVVISDTGHGMNENTRVHSFRPFFTTKPTGNGLGLMLTRSVVEEAQGTIQCESQVGEGTTFTMQFPV